MKRYGPATGFFHNTTDWGYGGTADQVVEQESGPVATGLLDQLGRPLYRVETKNPVGFDTTGPKR